MDSEQETSFRPGYRAEDETAAESSMSDTLSVAIITLNEEINLARTLASARFADEVIVVDSGSTDHTLEIARDAGARIFSKSWQGFASQKNFAIEQCSRTWILSLDADEELSKELQDEILALLRSKPHVDAYMIRRRNLFLGRWIRFGGYYPDPKLRLFRRCPMKGVPPARFCERPVHETIIFDGTCGTLKHDLIHHAYPTIKSYIEHMNRYSSLGAQVVIDRGKTSKSWWAFQYNIVIIPFFTFIWNYVFRLGFLDGREGLLLHAFHSFYTCWKYAKAWYTKD